MGKEYIPLFLDFNETTQDLEDAEFGRLIRAIVAYANGDDYEGYLTGREEMIAFRFLKGLVDRNAAISEKRAKAGANRNKTEQTETNENKTEQTETNSLTKTKINTKTNTKNKNKDIQTKFDRFWSAYPKHQSKPQALRAFSKVDPDDELMEQIMNAIEIQKQSDQWTKDGGQFIPLPATWLNNSRWEDDVLPSSTRKKAVPAQDFPQRDYGGVQDEMMDSLAKEIEAMRSQEVG